jgi:ABC-type nickel/cobalt efflux system permease component RcnA
LWNEIIGFLFLAIAVFMIRPTWKAYQKFQTDAEPGEAIVGLVGGAVLMLVGLIFGIHGFLKARRISRS